MAQISIHGTHTSPIRTHRPSVPRQRGNVSLDHLTVLNRQVEAARLLGLSQPDVSRLLRGSFREYSMERLLRFLTVLGRDVEIVIRRSRSQRGGRLSVGHKNSAKRPNPQIS